MSVGKARVYLYVDTPETLSLLANTKLGWKGLLGTNAQAYYEHFKFTTVKGCITLCPNYAFVLAQL